MPLNWDFPFAASEVAILPKQYGHPQGFAKAETLLLAMHEQIVASSGESPSKIQASIEHLAKFYESWHAAEPGKGYDAKAAEWRAKFPPDDGAADPAP